MGYQEKRSGQGAVASRITKDFYELWDKKFESDEIAGFNIPEDFVNYTELDEVAFFYSDLNEVSDEEVEICNEIVSKKVLKNDDISMFLSKLDEEKKKAVYYDDDDMRKEA